MSDKTCSNIHEGHRKRLRESYIKSNGSDALRDHQLLELLLFYAIPRRDVNPLAHRLVNRFGSLRGVLEASFSELAEEGVSQSTAILIKLVGDINFRAKIADADGKQLKNTDDAMDFCSALIAEEREEGGLPCGLSQRKIRRNLQRNCGTGKQLRNAVFVKANC